MRKSFLTVVSAVAAASLLAACSTDTTDDGAAAPSGASADATLAALVPESIKERGTLIVGAELTYAPAEYLDEDGTTAVGYDVDLANAIAAKLGLTAQIQAAEFAAIIPGIGTKFDVGISSFTITDERLEAVNMIEYFKAGEAYAVVTGNPDGIDPADVCGLTVGVQVGTVQETEIADQSAACVDAGKAAIDVLPYPKQSDVTTALVGGKADLMFADSPIIQYAVKQADGQLEQLGEAFGTASQGIVVAKDDAELTDAIQQATQAIIDDGTYAAILEEWGVGASAVSAATLNPAGS